MFLRQSYLFLFSVAIHTYINQIANTHILLIDIFAFKRIETGNSRHKHKIGPLTIYNMFFIRLFL